MLSQLGQVALQLVARQLTEVAQLATLVTAVARKPLGTAQAGAVVVAGGTFGAGGGAGSGSRRGKGCPQEEGRAGVEEEQKLLLRKVDSRKKGMDPWSHLSAPTPAGITRGTFLFRTGWKNCMIQKLSLAV